ncbi:FHA domain-containing protein [Bifidobacterium bombi]|uniref:FHA domain protein n=1 Tax=Bifidobacterium bombi DSM 19703 TaxID=1341695 RepID=A0A086BNS5_9BIFI|nr:FHA domain-containing protein [Bifidobacterium bombi]KFF30589.1 FHA domain protein [Bifidobacterium bombi DSM 19703]
MSDQRNLPHWLVKVRGIELANVGPDESVEIGRRPIRPLRDDKRRRAEIDDDGRSVSKRHALLEVDGSGSARVTDLGSTNGTYRYGGNKDLVGLTAGSPYVLPKEGTWMQLGDVPVQFSPVILDTQDDAGPQVSDLFDYAVTDSQQDLAVGDMSVEDILSLRAGEPTRVFDASEVTKKVRHTDGDDAVSGSGSSAEGSHADGLGGTAAADSKNGVERGGSEASEPVDGRAGVVKPGGNREGDVRGASPSAEISESGSAARLVDHISVNLASGNVAQTQERNLFQDALDAESQVRQEGANGGKAQDVSVQEGHASQGTTMGLRRGADESSPDRLVMKDGRTPAVSPVIRESASGADRLASGSDGLRSAGRGRQPGWSHHAVAGPGMHSEESGDGVAQSISVDGSGVDDLPPQQGVPIQDGAGDSPVATMPEGSVSVGGSDAAGAGSAFIGYAVSGDGGPQRTNVFEPGSIFEKVSQGGFADQQKTVEEGGFTSQDAAKSADFSMQFEMARHKVLLPFLAMNPNLYDDLYAWLSAQGDGDIDAALSRNAGYEKYRESSGKGRS